jgi:hypothetical protein
MFHHRSKDFDPRIVAIAGHLRAIEGELARIGKSAGRTASAGARSAGDQIAEMIGPILSEIGDRFRRGQRTAIDEAANFGNEAFKVGAKVGNDALERIANQAKQRPLVTLAVAIGVGILIGMAGRRN